MTETIAPKTAIGQVQLFVSNLDRSVQYYQSLGMKQLNREGSQASLGVGERPLVGLMEKSGARRVSGVSGLYHFAIRVPDRKSLARVLYHLAESEMGVQGASDHGVSEALYMSDPDGNGIEIYSDRRRNEWPVDDLGKLQMGVEELDIDDLVLELKNGVEEWTGMPDGTDIGHIHLQVSNLAEAERFYVQGLGFQVMQRYQSGALFISAGGYHHHIGLNTWAGVGIPPQPEDAVGLHWFEIILPDKSALDAVVERLKAAGIAYEAQNGGVLVSDPSQNRILLKV